MHHAYLLVGEDDICLAYIKKHEPVFNSGADSATYRYQRFGIGDARTLTHEASLSPLQEPYRVFILILESITIEAQNALLKLLEEPHQKVRFYIIVPNEDILLSTLRSRLHQLSAVTQDVHITKEATDFLTCSYAERLSLVAERTKEADTEWMQHLLSGLELWAEKENDSDAMKVIIDVRTYERDRSASKKMLLEQLALSLSVDS